MFRIFDSPKNLLVKTINLQEKKEDKESSSQLPENIADNTLFIKHLYEDIQGKYHDILVLTCPPSSGKTYNLTMLKDFFDIRTAEQTQHQFDNYNISKETAFCAAHQGQYPVIYISFEKLFNVRPEQFSNQFAVMMIDLCKEYAGLIEEKLSNSDKFSSHDKRDFADMIKGDESFGLRSLKRLMEFLYEIYQKNLIILIEDMDKVEATTDVKIRQFLRAWFYSFNYDYKAVFEFVLFIQSDMKLSRGDLYPNDSTVYDAEDVEDCFGNDFGFSIDQVNTLFGYQPKNEILETLQISGWSNRYKPAEVEAAALIDAELGKIGRFSHDITNIVNNYLYKKAR